jgi:hypothetical protein
MIAAEDFRADDGARELARKIDEHVTRWFLQPGTFVGEVVADDRFFGYDGHEKILESVRSSPRNDDRYDVVFRALLDNYWGAEVEERRLNPDDLPEELKLLLNDAGISTWSSIARKAEPGMIPGATET